MTIHFPYFQLIRDPRDFVSYLVIRALLSPRLMSWQPCRRLIDAWFPTVTVRPPQLGGNTLCLSTRDASEVLILEEIFLENVYGELAKLPFAPERVIDCGAHVGMFSLLARQKLPNSSFTLFEPNPNNCSTLRKNVAANRLPFEVVEAAVSDHDGTVRFALGDSYGGHVTAEAADSAKQIEVKCLDLRERIRQQADKTLLLKLDIEGHEEVVLPHVLDSLPPRTILFLETHGGQRSWEKAVRLLRGAGFEVKHTRQRNLYTDGYAMRG